MVYTCKVNKQICIYICNLKVKVTGNENSGKCNFNDLTSYILSVVYADVIIINKLDKSHDS